MQLNTFRYFGIATFVCEAAIFIVLIHPRTRPVADTAAARAAVFFFFSTIMAIGLLMNKRWAAVAFSISTGVFAVLLINDSAAHIQPGKRLIGMTVSLLLLVPAAVTKKRWNEFDNFHHRLP